MTTGLVRVQNPSLPSSSAHGDAPLRLLESTFLEIHFTKLTKLTNVHSSASLHILHPDLLSKKYTRMDFVNKLHPKAFLHA